MKRGMVALGWIALMPLALACGNDSNSSKDTVAPAESTDTATLPEAEVAQTLATVVDNTVRLGGFNGLDSIMSGLSGDRSDGMGLMDHDGPIIPELPDCAALDIQANDISIDFGDGCALGEKTVSGSASIHREASDTEEVLTIVLGGIGSGEDTATGTVTVTRHISDVTIETEGLIVGANTVSGAVSIITNSLTSATLLAQVEGNFDGKDIAADIDLTVSLSNEGVSLAGSVAATIPDMGDVSADVDLLLAPGCKGPQGTAKINFGGRSMSIPLTCEGGLPLGK